jgi:hypothetical protein
VKIRQTGFADALDKEARLLELFARLVHLKAPPTPGWLSAGSVP